MEKSFIWDGTAETEQEMEEAFRKGKSFEVEFWTNEACWIICDQTKLSLMSKETLSEVASITIKNKPDFLIKGMSWLWNLMLNLN